RVRLDTPLGATAMHMTDDNHEQVAFVDPFVVEIFDLKRGAMEVFHEHAMHAQALNGIECRLPVRFQVTTGRAEEDVHTAPAKESYPMRRSALRVWEPHVKEALVFKFRMPQACGGTAFAAWESIAGDNSPSR